MEFTGERLVLGKCKSLIENEHLARYRFATQLVQGMRVADIACGTGYGTQMLAKAGAQHVHGIDISGESIQLCRESYDTSNVTYNVDNAQKLATIKDGEFDMVVSFETIEHLPNADAYLGEMTRILRPGGKFLVSTPDRRIASLMYRLFGRPANKHHVREYTEGELLNLLSTRFQIEATYGQAFVPRWLVIWPVQFCIKVLCRIIGTKWARNLKDNLYSCGGNVEVVKRPSTSRIPKYWIVSCVHLGQSEMPEASGTAVIESRATSKAG